MEIIAGIAVLAALFCIRAVALHVRRGTVACSVRTGERGWQSGVARYAGGELHWVPFLGLRLRPRHAIARRGLIVSRRRPLDAGEGPEGYWMVEAGPIALAMSEDALTGFLAWLESAPPSAHLDPA
ncbi:DUF2550 domain-containing protein [Acrocarpospora macrocephala]|uniref:DUF2550 domain-containing protein n=1 Tax=Acrocarpospora macrocephala TaxID=150177 RepID=A0A5M3WV01_9ACTN|nr:DUF2550 domain-containing protein [Acrocarpospora macrocephala]GES09968.1 hypothetical protein Amac_035640 [Acrocarpospora macrocephala]